MILKAIQAVSRYALENEAEFVADLKSIWDESKTKSEDTGQHELEEARKRVDELDAMIQNLYESSVKGILPEQLRKKQEKGKRASERQQQKLKALREAAKDGDPEAVAKYEEHLRKQRERNHRYRQQVQEARAADPEYLQKLDEKERLKQERLLEKERRRSERSAQRAKLTRAELKEKAKTDQKGETETAACPKIEARDIDLMRSEKEVLFHVPEFKPAKYPAHCCAVLPKADQRRQLL